MILTVIVPNLETFEAYDYGYGTVLHVSPTMDLNRPDWVTVTVEYHEGDRYHAERQMNRFASGLYFTWID